MNKKTKKFEEGGVFGVFGTSSAPRDVFLGLYALQHRGQVSCGAVLSDNFKLSVAKGAGLVSEVVEPALPRLKGNMGIGHVRYGTREDAEMYAQPLTSNYLKGNISISVAGKITNADSLMADLEEKGAIFQSGSDAEVMAHLFAFARLKTVSIEQAVLTVMGMLEGAYSVLIMSSSKLLAFRDRDGLRPLCMGSRPEGKHKKEVAHGQSQNGDSGLSCNNSDGLNGDGPNANAPNCNGQNGPAQNQCADGCVQQCAAEWQNAQCGEQCQTAGQQNAQCGAPCDSKTEYCDEKIDKKHSYFFASEDIAFSAVGAEKIRDIAPGELVLITKEGCASFTDYCGEQAKTCIYEYMYFARPDSDIDGANVYLTRMEAGRRLFRACPAQADVVIGVPSAGLHYAMGYAHESGIPFGDGLIRNYYLGRTGSRDEAFRQSTVNVKLNVLKAAVTGKRVVLVDDSMVRGTTAKRIIAQLRAGGAKEIHLRIACPRFSRVCPFSAGIESGLKRVSIEKIRKDVGADSLMFLPVSEMDSLGVPKNCCKKCFE